MRKKTDIKIRCNDIEQQLKEWGKVPTNSEDTNLLHKVNNLYRELGDKPEVQRLMTLYPINQLYTKWGASVDPEEHPEMETLGFINRSVELPYSRAKRYIKQCVEKYGELPGLNTWPMYFVFQDDLNRRNYYYGFSKDQLDFIGSLIDGGYLTDEKLIVKYFSCRLNDKSVIEKIDAILDKYKLITLGYLARHLHEGLVLDISYLHSFFDEMTQSNGNKPRGICKEVRSRYMLIEPSYGQYAQEIIICRGYEDLAKVDFKEAARLLPYRVLPNYSLDFTDADDINYARAFLFHMEREGGWGGMPDDTRGIIHIDTDHTFLDDLKNGFCMFSYINTRMNHDAPEKSLDWCMFLMRMDSALLKRNHNSKLYKSLKYWINERADDASKAKFQLLNSYLSEHWDFMI